MATADSTVTYKDIPGFPGYRVGDDGSVWTCRKRVYPGGGGCRSAVGDHWRRVLARPRSRGHLEVKLLDGSGRSFVRQVHRLVLEAFVGPCPEGQEGCHDPDRNPANNTLKNLRWATRTENVADSIRHGTFPRGEANGKRVVTEDVVRAIRASHSRGATIAALARDHQVSTGCVACIVHRRNWKHVE